jgi:hypothetical protein
VREKGDVIALITGASGGFGSVLGRTLTEKGLTVHKLFCGQIGDILVWAPGLPDFKFEVHYSLDSMEAFLPACH